MILSNKPVNGLELRARVNSMLRIKKQYDRIQSFSKLQRNNIHTLANNLNEIRLDLAVGFPNEFNAPLSIISDNIDYLKQHLTHLSVPDSIQILEASERSVTRLHTLTQQFWFYLKLLIDTPTPHRDDSSNPKSIVEQLLRDRCEQLPTLNLPLCEVEDTSLAVNADLAEWIFNELLDYVFDRCQTDFYLKIHGQAIDGAFHLSLSSLPSNNQTELNSDISSFIQFNSSSEQNPELAIGLKIVKKIVEIYDGLFLMSVGDLDEMTFYLTLPLITESVSTRVPVAIEHGE